jgi:predicted kinase
MRSAVARFAKKWSVPFFFVETRATPEVCRKRIQARVEGKSVSDGRPEIYEEFVAQWEPVDELDSSRHLVIDTTLPLETTAARLRERLPTWPPGLNQ